MQMDLPAFFISFGVIAAVYGLASAGGLYLYLANFKYRHELGEFVSLRNAVARSWLDTGMVAGVLVAAIELVSAIGDSQTNAAASVGDADIKGVYSYAAYVLSAFIWGGILTGAGYCMLDEESELRIQNHPIYLAVAALPTLYIVISYLNGTPLAATAYFSNSYALQFWLVPLILLAVFGIKRREPLLVTLTNANIVATLTGMAFGIALWFVEGASWIESIDAVFVTVNVLFLGCLLYLVLYLFAVWQNLDKETNYRTKTWHIAESAAFFIFLLFAPVGSTEYLREKTDQTAQHQNNEAQQLRIEQLEAQIKLLSAKVGEA